MTTVHQQRRQAEQTAARVIDKFRGQSAYVRGVRAGRLAGFVWGLLLGGLAVAASFELGWMSVQQSAPHNRVQTPAPKALT